MCITNGNKSKENGQESRTSRIKNYTERDRLTLSNHSSFDYNRRHVKLLLNSPSSEILGSIVHSGTSNSLNCYHQTKLATPAIVNKQILSDDNDNDGSAVGESSATKNGTNQKWKSVKAVMAYYCTLRRIKRNGPFSIILVYLYQKQKNYYESKDIHMLFKYLVLQSTTIFS